MLRHSLIAAAVAVVTMTAAAGAGSAQTTTTHPRTVVHPIYRYEYTYEPAPGLYYHPDHGWYYYGPNPVVPAANAAGATACFALSLVGAC
jgi:hypothetical protein